jgi:glycosyltransferase involved in cell wall biosynthesis
VSTGRIVSIQTTAERGGAEYANVDLLDALRERGHDVRLVTNLPDLATGTDLVVRRIDLGPKLSHRTVSSVGLAAPVIVWRLAQALWRERPVAATLVHFKKEQLLVALLPGRLTGRIVWAEWGPVPPALRRGLPRLLFALAARRAAAVLAVSEGTRRTLVDAGVAADKVTIMPNLLDVDAVAADEAGGRALRAELGIGEDEFVAGCISRFQQRKRNDVVIDALAHTGDSVTLLMAGEGDQEDALRRRAAPYGDRVRFVGSVRGHVESFLSACDVLVFAPSPTEGAPRVIVMAQLVGVPVIATDPEGAAEMIPDGAGTVVTPSHDPVALAAALMEYRTDPPRRQREADAARVATLEHHDPERVLRTVETALDGS